MWLDPLVERRHLKNINVTTNVVNIRMELLKEKRATENKQVGIYCTCTDKNRAALEWNPQGKRRRGRPMESWRDTRMAELKEKDVTWAAAKKAAQNRIRWKAMVSDLCSARN